MKKIFLFEPSIASNNIGDEIIVTSIKNEMEEFFDKSFLVEMATHTPISNRYMYYLGVPDYKFILGSNIIVGSLIRFIHLRQWMLNIFTLHNLKNSIFIGVGAQRENIKIDFFTKICYKFIFNKKFIHSVRDGYTEELLRRNGIHNILNTGCPTMWRFSEEFCSTIPKKKGEDVVFTLTDYKPDVVRDEHIISTLKKNYKNVYFWPQGYKDMEYLNSLKNIENISIVNPNTKSFEKLLSERDIDFVGTRLHGGIRALQLKKRTIIIAIDNRARELYKDFNIPVLLKENIDELEEMISKPLITNIKLPVENIKTFTKQFNINYK